MQKTLKLLAAILFFLSLTAFTSFVEKDTPLAQEPTGNPDPDVGIVLKHNSTGLDVLADSSQKTRFGVLKTIDGKHIDMITTPIDLKPHKFSFVDDEVGFTADEVYFVTINFDEKTHEWSSFNFVPYFIPSAWKTESELVPYLKKWTNVIDNAKWVRDIHTDKSYHWEAEQIPRPSPQNKRRSTYHLWNAKGKYEALISVTRNTNYPGARKDVDEPVYTIRFRVEKERNYKKDVK